MRRRDITRMIQQGLDPDEIEEVLVEEDERPVVKERETTKRIEKPSKNRGFDRRKREPKEGF